METGKPSGDLTLLLGIVDRENRRLRVGLAWTDRRIIEAVVRLIANMHADSVKEGDDNAERRES